jgi:hypothetical protein
MKIVVRKSVSNEDRMGDLVANTVQITSVFNRDYREVLTCKKFLITFDLDLQSTSSLVIIVC